MSTDPRASPAVETARPDYGAGWLASPFAWFLLALACAVVVRLPWVPYSVIDWDESTFALMGDSLLRGHLPYAEMWENKPPLIFVCFALIQVVFGKSIIAIRATGIVLVALAAWLSAMTARRAFGLGRWSVMAIIPVVAAATITPGSGALMSEHLAIVFLAATLYLLSAERFDATRGFLIGLCTSLAVLTRTNLAYPALLLGAAAFLLPLAHRTTRARFIAALVAGGVLPLALLLFAYRDALGLLYRAAVLSPLMYADGGRIFTGTWFRVAGDLLFALGRPGILPVVIGLVAGTGFVARMDASRPPGSRMATILLLGWLGSCVGISAGGRVFGHYLIQLLPFGAPLFAVAVAGLDHRRPVLSRVAALLVVSWWGVPVSLAYVGHAQRLLAGMPLWSDRATNVTRYLDAAGARGEVLYLADAHIAYWLLDAKVPTRSIHPSNLGRVEMMRALEGPTWTTCGEFAAIFAQRPTFVALPLHGPKRWDAAASACLQAHLSAGYRPDRVIDQVQIYRRRELNATPREEGAAEKVPGSR